MMLERVRRIALRINIDHENPGTSFRHEPSQMHSEGRLSDTALLVVETMVFMGRSVMKLLSVPVFIDLL